MSAGASSARRDRRAPPRLEPGALHIWSADLDGPFAASWLSAEEIERASQIVRPRARRRWMAARSFLRALLGAYLDRDPATLRFSSIERGKPVLDDSGEAPTVRFNLSHSGPLGVCALSRTCAVGVDVQLPSRRTSTRADEPELLRAWTALEAERKRTGLGLGAAERSGRLNEPRPWLARFDLGGDGAGAVALALPPSRLSLGVWRSGGGCTFRLLDLF